MYWNNMTERTGGSSLNTVLEKVRAECSAAAGLTGKGVGIAVLDTGVFLHNDLKDRILAFRDILSGESLPYDDSGHGTHICGIIAGSGKSSGGRIRGIAPGAGLVVVKVLDRNGNGSTRDLLEGIHFVLDFKEKYGIRILNISAGSSLNLPVTEECPLVRCVDEAWDAGLTVVASAGNNGPREMSITMPGNSRKIITVGSYEDGFSIMGNDRQRYDSGRGPTPAGIMKPDLVAPGFRIISCAARQNHYMIKSGTSMSAPIVSGAVALLMEKYPCITNHEIKLLLLERSDDLGLKRTHQGSGLLNLERLLS